MNKGDFLFNERTRRLIWKLVVVSPLLFSSSSVEASVRMASSVIYAEQNQVRGKVLGASGEGLAGVTVSEKGGANITQTDKDGNFTIIVSSMDVVLVFSSISYRTIEVKAEQATLVKLEIEEGELEEVVVVGYGAMRKSDLTGSVSTVSGKDLENINSPNVIDKLQGKVSGLNINTGDAKPGQIASFTVRGENSISASNSPLLILDGIPFSGSLGDISPTSIENISVLKDASSTAIYGSRAANGVILITSKKGMIGKPRINYNSYVGLQTAQRRLNLMKGPQYIQYMRDYQITQGKTGEELNPENYLFENVLNQWKKGEEVDWQNQVFNSTAPIHDHQLSFSGGTQSTNYYAAVSYLNQEGVVKNTPYERINVNLNLTQNLNDWMKIGLLSQFSQSNRNGVQPNIGDAIKLSPYGLNRDEKGEVITYPMYAQTLYAHPFANEKGVRELTNRSVYANAYLDVKLPIKGLSFKTTFGTNYKNREEGEYYGSNTLAGLGVKGYGKVYNSNDYDWTWENLLTYNQTFGKHKIDIVGLYSSQASKYKYSDLYGEDFVVDNSYHNMGAAGTNQKISTELINTALLSYMGRINYGYDNRYLLTITGRSDGYSAFAKGDKWAFFPSIAGAWIVSEEDFFDVDFVNYLKVRASYGENGNQAINPYQTYDRLTKEPYVFGDGGTAVNGFIMKFDAIGNKGLKWETTRSVNIGLDFSVVNSRVSGNVDFYKTNTFDLLMNRQVPVMNGYNSIMSNVGETENLGIEIGLVTKNVIKDKFSWSSSVNFAYNKNKILELRGDGKDDLANAWLIGKPMRVFYDYKVIGIWQEDEDIINSHQPKAKPGDAKLADLNGDGIINAQDRTVIGSKIPVYNIGFGNEMTYKNWHLSIFMDGAFDVKKQDDFVNVERFIPFSGANYLADVSYWTPETPNSKAPSPGYVPVNNHQYYINASYWRIKDISVGYTFMTEGLSRMKIGAIKTYFNVRNVHTFTKVKGYNPESSSNILSPYPIARTFSLGANIQF